MATAKLLRRISVEDYLAAEEESDVKHEYVHGRLYAMAGASDAHNRIVMNLSGQLYAAALKANCTNYASDMKVNVNEYTYYYPDFMTICETDKGDYTKQNPCLIVEVLSKSTRKTDEREKREAYLAMPSLQTYLLIDSQKRSVTKYERSEEGWLESTLEEAGSVAFGCLKASLSLSDIYRGVNFGSTPED